MRKRIIQQQKFKISIELYHLICWVFVGLSFISCTEKNELFINYNNPNITYEGRIDSSQVNGAELYWSGTSIKLNFKGESIAALMVDNNGDNYYNISIDNDSVRVFKPDTIKQYYTLASGLSEGEHTIELFKRTEWNRGNSTFYGFLINGNSEVISPPKQKNRKIEFYGNSITAGYAVEDYSGNDSPDSTYTNNYNSYAAITARHFNADYSCICKSGIGITVSWKPLIMPEMYDRLVPEDSLSKWNFSSFTPDVVVVNLLQNDSWIVNLSEHEEFRARFGNETPDKWFIINAYQQFIYSLRKHYPKAHIICSLGNMDITQKGSVWPNYVSKAVNNLNDSKVYTHFMPFKNTPGHPNKEEQQVMATSLIQFITKNIDW